MGAHLSHNPSFIWRSIFASHVLVRGGQRWRVGNGKSISIWNDPSLRTFDNSYISTATVHGTEHWKVADMMNVQGTSWNWGIVNELFNDRDKEEILKITIANPEAEDKLIWKFNNKGYYTVKSAYIYAMESLIDNEAYRVPREWMEPWNLQVP